MSGNPYESPKVSDAIETRIRSVKDGWKAAFFTSLFCLGCGITFASALFPASYLVTKEWHDVFSPLWDAFTAFAGLSCIATLITLVGWAISILFRQRD